jgi:hypothetical protein
MGCRCVATRVIRASEATRGRPRQGPQASSAVLAQSLAPHPASFPVLAAWALRASGDPGLCLVPGWPFRLLRLGETHLPGPQPAKRGPRAYGRAVERRRPGGVCVGNAGRYRGRLALAADVPHLYLGVLSFPRCNPAPGSRPLVRSVCSSALAVSVPGCLRATWPQPLRMTHAR